MKTLGRAFTAFAAAMTLAAALEMSDNAEGIERAGLDRHGVSPAARLNLSDCLRGLTDASWPEAYRAICSDLASDDPAIVGQSSLALHATEAPAADTSPNRVASSSAAVVTAALPPAPARDPLLTEVVPLAAPARRLSGQDAADRAAEAMAEAAAEAGAAHKDETAMLETASLEASDVRLAPGPQSLGTLNRRTATARTAPSTQNPALTTPDHSSVHPVPPASIEPPMPVDAPVELNASQTAKLADTASTAGSASCRIAANGATSLRNGAQSRVVPPQLATQKASLVHQPGVALLVDSACMVESPVNGKVMYAGEFKGYLGVIIVRLASGQQLIAAGLDRIDVKRGDAVTVGQTLGVTSAALAPALAAAYRRDKADKPHSLLYFDMRNSKGDGDKLAWLQAAN